MRRAIMQAAALLPAAHCTPQMVEAHDTSRRLRTVAHLVDEASVYTAPAMRGRAEQSRLSCSNSSAFGSHRPSSAGLRTRPQSHRSPAHPGQQVPEPAAAGPRPGTGDVAVKSPRSLWRYVESLASEDDQYSQGDEQLLHGLPLDNAAFCREMMGRSSRRVYFPPWIQRPEASWEDTVHTFEHHRMMWAGLSQTNRRRVLQVPQEELLSRAASEGPGSGGAASFAMPANCAELLMEYLPDERFGRAVQEAFLHAMLHGQALLPVHALTKYGRAREKATAEVRQLQSERQNRFATEQIPQRRRGRGRGRVQRQRQRRPRAEAPTGGRSNSRSGGGSAAAAANEREQLSATAMTALFESLDTMALLPTTFDTSTTGAAAARPDSAGSLQGSYGTESSVLHAGGEPEPPSVEQATRVLGAAMARALPIEPAAALAHFRYPWKMPFFIRHPGFGSAMPTDRPVRGSRLPTALIGGGENRLQGTVSRPSPPHPLRPSR